MFTILNLGHHLIVLEVLVDGNVKVKVSQCVEQIFTIDVGAHSAVSIKKERIRRSEIKDKGHGEEGGK